MSNPITLMRCATGDFFGGDPSSDKWRGEAVTWWKALPADEFDASVKQSIEWREMAQRWTARYGTAAEAVAALSARVAKLEALLSDIRDNATSDIPRDIMERIDDALEDPK